MEETLTVGELIEQLSKFNKDKKVVVSATGFNSSMDWDAPLVFEDRTVDEFKGVVRINFSII